MNGVYMNQCLNTQEILDSISCLTNNLISSDFLRGISIGVIQNDTVVYQQAFGVRNPQGDSFTVDTNAQLEYVSLLPLSIYMARLSQLGDVCPRTQLVDVGYIPPNTRGANVSTTVVDLLSQSQSYQWLDTELTYLLGYEPSQLLEFLNNRIFSLRHNDHLSRNSFRSFSSKNLPVIQGFLEALSEKFGGVSIFLEILNYLNSNGITNIGYGTSSFSAQPNRATGLMRKNCCWENGVEFDNVDNYEGSRGAFGNINGLLSLIRLILNNGTVGGTEIVSPIALKRYFRENNTRIALWDAFKDPENKQIPDFDVLKGGGYRTSMYKTNFHFIPGITTNGVRSLVSWDPETKTGVSILSRGNSAFPEALAMYIHVALCQRNVCEAYDAFNFMYRLWTPYVELNMLNVSCEKPDINGSCRLQSIPLDGEVFIGGEGHLEMSNVGGILFGKFGLINELVEFKPVSLDNYRFDLIDRNGITHNGQIQFHYNATLNLIQADASVFNKRGIQYFQQQTQLPDICNLDSIDLPPLEDPCCEIVCCCEGYESCNRQPCDNNTGLFPGFCPKPITYRIPERKDCCTNNEQHCCINTESNCCIDTEPHCC